VYISNTLVQHLGKLTVSSDSFRPTCVCNKRTCMMQVNETVPIKLFLMKLTVFSAVCLISCSSCSLIKSSSHSPGAIKPEAYYHRADDIVRFLGQTDMDDYKCTDNVLFRPDQHCPSSAQRPEPIGTMSPSRFAHTLMKQSSQHLIFKGHREDVMFVARNSCHAFTVGI